MPDAKVKILVVDDDPVMRLLLSQVFMEFGYHVRSAEGGSSALAKIQADIPDIIVSNLNMPGMSGFELMSVVRRRFPKIKVIAMSSAFSGDRVPPGVTSDAFYEKGANLHSLLQMVDVMAHPRVASRFRDKYAALLKTWQDSPDTSKPLLRTGSPDEQNGAEMAIAR